MVRESCSPDEDANDPSAEMVLQCAVAKPVHGAEQQGVRLCSLCVPPPSSIPSSRASAARRRDGIERI